MARTDRFANGVVVIALLWAVASSTPALAQTSLSGLSLEELGNVVVSTVSKTPETLLKSPAAAYVLTSDDIRRSGATSLPELLRTVPGVEVARIDSDHWSVGIRGFGDGFSKSVLVLIDGRNVYTPLFAGILWGVQDVVLEDIERLEVIRGPGGTVWGANAVNGVINIVTKSSRDTKGVLASLQAGTTDYGIGSVRYGGAHGQDLTYRVYAKGFSRGPEYHSDGHEFDAWHMGQGGFRLDWSKPRESVTLQGDIYKATEGQSVAFASFSPPQDLISYDPLDLAGGNLLLQWRRTFEHDHDVQLRVYYDRTSLVGPQLGETRNTLDVDVVHHVAAMPRQDLRWGVGLHYSPSQFQQTVPSLILDPASERDSIYSAFAQDELAIVRNRLSLTLGAKLEHNNFTGAEVQPSARLLWTPTRTQSFWGAVTRAVRTPSQLEEDVQLTRFLKPAPPLPTFLQVAGNRAFQPERVIGYEGGYRAAIGEQAFVDLSLFRNRHDDLQSFGQVAVTVAATPPPAHILGILPYTNGAAGTSDGIEVASDWKVNALAQIKASYSYLDVNVHNTTSVPDILSVVATYNGSSPHHQIVLQPILTLPRGWEFDQTYRYVSALPAQFVPAYTTLDLRLAWRATSAVDIAFVGQSLFQEHHVEFAHSPGPIVGIKRAAYVSVTWHR